MKFFLVQRFQSIALYYAMPWSLVPQILTESENHMHIRLQRGANAYSNSVRESALRAVLLLDRL